MNERIRDRSHMRPRRWDGGGRPGRGEPWSTRDVALRVAGIAALTAAAAGAGYMAYLYASEPSRRRRHDLVPGGSLRATASATIDRDIGEVYARWRDLESLPRIMSHLESVREFPDGRSRWTALGPAGLRIEWESELIDEHENERLAWRSTEDARVPNEGTVRFRNHPVAGTEVHVELVYHPPAGRLGQAVAALFGREPNQQLREDLRRFKRRLEAAQAVTDAYSRPAARGT